MITVPLATAPKVGTENWKVKITVQDLGGEGSVSGDARAQGSCLASIVGCFLIEGAAAIFTSIPLSLCVHQFVDGYTLESGCYGDCTLLPSS